MLAVKRITVYDMEGEVVESFYGDRPLILTGYSGSRAVCFQYATLFEDAGNIYMVRWKTLPVTD